MTAMKRIGMMLDPLDVLFFRDGRPFGAAARVGGALPFPQTLAGAVRTGLLRHFDCDLDALRQSAQSVSVPTGTVSWNRDWFAEVLKRCGAPRWIADLRVRGPWLARVPTRWNLQRVGEAVTPEVLVPVPATLHVVKKSDHGELVRLAPLTSRSLPGWDATQSGQAGRLPLWTRNRQPTEPARGYLTWQGLKAFLRGERVEAGERLDASALMDTDYRTGIEIDPDRFTAAESKIYGANFLVLKRNVPLGRDAIRWDIVFYAELEIPDEASLGPASLPETLAFGGEGRRVRVEAVSEATWDEVQPPSRSPGKPLLLLTTPGLFVDPHLPAACREKLVAASVPGGVAVSGWDLARGGPKPNRFATAAGSVFFLEHLPESLPSPLSDEIPDREQGWGCYLKGTWIDE